MKNKSFGTTENLEFFENIVKIWKGDSIDKLGFVLVTAGLGGIFTSGLDMLLGQLINAKTQNLILYLGLFFTFGGIIIIFLNKFYFRDYLVSKDSKNIRSTDELESDKKTIMEILDFMKINSMNYFFNQATSGFFRGDILISQEYYSDYINSVDFHLFDQELKKMLFEFDDEFHKCFDFIEYITPIKNDMYKFDSSQKVYQPNWDKDFNKYKTSIMKSRDQFHKILEYIKNKFPTITIN